MAAEVAMNIAQVMGVVEGAVHWAGVAAEELESVLLAVQWVFDPVTAWKEERYPNLCTDLVEALSEATVLRTLRGEGEVRLAEAEVVERKRKTKAAQARTTLRHPHRP